MSPAGHGAREGKDGGGGRRGRASRNSVWNRGKEEVVKRGTGDCVGGTEVR